VFAVQSSFQLDKLEHQRSDAQRRNEHLRSLVASRSSATESRPAGDRPGLPARAEPDPAEPGGTRHERSTVADAPSRCPSTRTATPTPVPPPRKGARGARPPPASSEQDAHPGSPEAGQPRAATRGVQPAGRDRVRRARVPRHAAPGIER
jgi:hypothetical protein